jgi:hypothetical protein
METRYFALIAGIVYAVVGVLGFVPATLQAPPADAPAVTVTSGYGLLFGLFPVNVLHSLVHFVVGVAGIFAYATYRAARTYAAAVAVVFAVLTIMGILPELRTTFGILPLYGHDVWLHALTAIVAAYFGFGRRRIEAETISADRTRRVA